MTGEWIFLCTILLSVLVKTWWIWRDYLNAGCVIPGPPALPLLGNLLSLSTNPETLFNTLIDLHKTYGRVFRFWRGTKLAVFITDPADIQAILGNPKVINRDFYLLFPFQKIMGSGLLVNRDEQWSTHRKLLNPGFRFKALRGYIDTFGNRSEQLVRGLDEVADGRTFDPLDALGRVAMESIRDTVYGTNVDWPEENFMELFVRAGRLMTKCAVRPWLLFESVFRQTNDGKVFYHLRQEVNKRSSKVITLKLEEFHKNKMASVGKMRPFVDVLVEASETEGSLMTLLELQEELNNLVVAAVDTSAATLANIVCLMGIHPDIQRQVIAEVEEIFGADSRQPTAHDLQRMEFIEHCIKETLRLFPTAPWINREIDQDVVLPSGFTVPKGSAVVVFAYAVHRDPHNYTDPDRYWPDRWLQENTTDHHPYAFVAFGGGRRNCIGQKYAWLQMKTVVSAIFRRYRVTTESTLTSMDRFGALPVLRPLEGYHIQLHRQDKKI